MVALGVLLVLVAAAIGIGLIAAMAQLTPAIEVDVPGGTLDLPPVAVLVAGMVIVAVFWLGWVLLRSGVRRGHRQRVESKEAARSAEVARVDNEKRTKEEFAARERQLVQERRRHEEETAALLKEADERTTAVSDQPGTQGGPTPSPSAEFTADRARPTTGATEPPGRQTPTT